MLAVSNFFQLLICLSLKVKEDEKKNIRRPFIDLFGSSSTQNFIRKETETAFTLNILRMTILEVTHFVDEINATKCNQTISKFCFARKQLNMLAILICERIQHFIWWIFGYGKKLAIF